MYGKIYTSMFTGSMCGSGSIVFAVFTYAIVNARPDCGSTVSLNPLALSGILGEDPDDIDEAIRELCAPDDKSRTEVEGGRRLIRIGQSMDYRVVNLEKYRFLDSEDQKTYWREQKRKQRQKTSFQVSNNQHSSRTVTDIPGKVPKCPHADAGTDTKAKAVAEAKAHKEGGEKKPPLLSESEKIRLEDEAKRLRKENAKLRNQDFYSESDKLILRTNRERISKIDKALHISL